MSNPASLPPGFRFHPTDEELLLHYLRNRASSAPCPVAIIADVDIYKCDPWELPAKAAYGDREWYFFSPRDRKYPNGFRPNRAAASGYWKATGTDKPIHASKGKGKDEVIGVKKALVFYKGKPPRGLKTNWIMHEYRLMEAQSANSYRPVKLIMGADSSMRLDDWVLCRIYKKNSHLQALVIDQEESGQDLAGPNSSIFNKNLKQQLHPGLQKPASNFDFPDDYSSISQLLGNSAELMPTASAFIGQTGLAQLSASNSGGAAIVHGGNNNNAAQPHLQMEPPVLVADSSMKRQRMMECYLDTISNGGLHPPKRQNCGETAYSNFAEVQLDTNLLDHHFLNQQLLLNSHLGFQ